MLILAFIGYFKLDLFIITFEPIRTWAHMLNLAIEFGGKKAKWLSFSGNSTINCNSDDPVSLVSPSLVIDTLNIYLP